MPNPPAAGVDFSGAGLFVDPPLSTKRELEVLDRIGDIDRRAIDPRLFECFVEKGTRWTNKWPAGQILLVAGLFADEHDVGIERPFAKDRLRRIPVKVTALASPGVSEKLLPGRSKVASRSDRPNQPFCCTVGHRSS